MRRAFQAHRLFESFLDLTLLCMSLYLGSLNDRYSGCTAKAIRLYEQMGLLSPQRRGSYRLYTAHHLTLVQMIRTAQAVGFKLGRRSLKWTRQGRGCPKGQSQARASGPGTSRSSFL